MSFAPLVWFKGNLQPPLYGNIDSDVAGDVIPIGATVKFYMRESASSTLKVAGAAAVVDDAPAGLVHYDKQAADVDTAGFFIGWWRVTLANGQYEETPEFLIQIVEHAPLGNEYVTPEELKASRQIGKDFANADVRLACQAASRMIDGACGRPFYLGASEDRYYTPVSSEWVQIDDAAVISAVNVGGTARVLDTDYAVERVTPGGPVNVLRSFNGRLFTPSRINELKVTAQFGWSQTPPEIKAAAVIVAGRLIQLMREGVQIALAFDGAPFSIVLGDRSLQTLIAPYVKSSLEA